MLASLYHLDGRSVDLGSRLSGVFFGSTEEQKRVDELVEQWQKGIDIQS